MGRVSFLLTGTNCFHVKAEDGRFTAAGSRCRQNLKHEISRSRSADYVQNGYFSSFSQSYKGNSFVALQLMLQSSFSSELHG